jgi:twitching motility protein PilT
VDVPATQVAATPSAAEAAGAAQEAEAAAPEPESGLRAAVEPATSAVVLPLTRSGARAERPPDDAAVHRTTLGRLLRIAAIRGASALYVVTDMRPVIRVDGEIQILEDEAPLDAAEVAAVLMELAPEPSRQALQKGANTEWTCDVAEVGRIRCMSFHDHRGQGGIFGMLPARALSVEQLGLSREIQALCREAEGLVLVTGPRSSGKSTLMSAFVDLINHTRADHVVTLETQIKFVHESQRSLVSQRELRGDAEELGAVVHGVLREDPDVLVIEELRSADLIAAALEAAESGRLVFAGLPAACTAAAVDRIVEQFPQDRRPRVQGSLAATLRGVIAQVLLRKVGGGRVAAREILLNTPTVAALIAEGQTHELGPALDAGRKYGMAPLNDALVAFVRMGAVAPAEAYRKSADREGLLAQLRREGVDTFFLERLA